MDKENIKLILAIAAFIGAILFGVGGFLCPPLAIIDSSVLWFTSQLLVFVATLLGLSLHYERANTIARTENNK